MFESFEEYQLNEAALGMRTILKNELLKNKRRYADHSMKSRIFLKTNTSIHDVLLDITNACVNLGLEITDELVIVEGGQFSDRAQKVYVKNFDTIEGEVEEQAFAITVSQVDKTVPTTEQQEKCSLLVFKKFVEEGHGSVADLIPDLKKIWTAVYKQQDWLNSFQQQASSLKAFLGNEHGYEYFRTEKFAEEIYNIAKNLTGLRQLDTWNPADVWMVKNPKKHIKILKSYGDISYVNSYLVKKLESKEIIPISLKKTRGTASVQQINIEKQYVQTFLQKIQCDLFWDEELRKFSQLGGVIEARDGSILTLRFSSKTSYAIEGQKKNSAAQLGKTPTGVWKKLLKTKANAKAYKGPSKDEKILKKYFDYLIKEGVETRTRDWNQFIEGMRIAWSDRSLRESVYMQKAVTMEILHNYLQNNKRDREEILNKMLMASQKIGDEYGPFIKIY